MMALGGIGADALLVGIGTSTPNAYLNIYGSSSATTLLRVATSTNQNILVVDKNGNMGLDVASPMAKLDINGTASSTGFVVNGNSTTTGNQDVGTLTVGTDKLVIDSSGPLS